MDVIDLADAALSAEDLKRFGKPSNRKRRRRRTTVTTPAEPNRRGMRYVLGPFPVPTLRRAYEAHSAGPVVLLAIKSRADVLRRVCGIANPEIKVTSALCAQLGIKPSTRQRTVRALADAGLIEVHWPGGFSAPRARLVPGLFDVDVNAIDPEWLEEEE